MVFISNQEIRNIRVLTYSLQYSLTGVQNIPPDTSEEILTIYLENTTGEENIELVEFSRSGTEAVFIFRQPQIGQSHISLPQIGQSHISLPQIGQSHISLQNNILSTNDHGNMSLAISWYSQILFE